MGHSFCGMSWRHTDIQPFPFALLTPFHSFPSSHHQDKQPNSLWNYKKWVKNWNKNTNTSASRQGYRREIHNKNNIREINSRKASERGRISVHLFLVCSRQGITMKNKREEKKNVGKKLRKKGKKFPLAASSSVVRLFELRLHTGTQLPHVLHPFFTDFAIYNILFSRFLFRKWANGFFLFFAFAPAQNCGVN